MRKEEFEKQAGQYTSVFEINLDGIKRNVQRIRDFIGHGHELIGVVKGDAYGFGLERIAELLVQECNVQMLAVAHVCEGIRLREDGIQCGILVMSAVPERLLPQILFLLLPPPFLPVMSASVSVSLLFQSCLSLLVLPIQTQILSVQLLLRQPSFLSLEQVRSYLAHLHHQMEILL